MAETGRDTHVARKHSALDEPANATWCWLALVAMEAPAVWQTLSHGSYEAFIFPFRHAVGITGEQFQGLSIPDGDQVPL